VINDGLALKYVINYFSDDKAVVLAAVENNGMILRFYQSYI
jgi:hypothetical protein